MADVCFWYFVKSSLTDRPLKNPVCMDSFIGDIGDYCEIDGVGFYITDYAIDYKEE